MTGACPRIKEYHEIKFTWERKAVYLRRQEKFVTVAAPSFSRKEKGKWRSNRLVKVLCFPFLLPSEQFDSIVNSIGWKMEIESSEHRNEVLTQKMGENNETAVES